MKKLKLFSALAFAFVLTSNVFAEPLPGIAVAPTTGSTVTVFQGERVKPIAPAGTLAALTLQLPTCSTNFDGNETHFYFTQLITSLTVTSVAGTIVGAPSSIGAVGAALDAYCYGSTATWYVRN